MIIICTGINSRDRTLLTAYLISQGIPGEDLEAIVGECFSKAESYPQPRECGYSDFATICYKPDLPYQGSNKWIIKIDRAYNGPHG